MRMMIIINYVINVIRKPIKIKKAARESEELIMAEGLSAV